jgi:hypothetical protein
VSEEYRAILDRLKGCVISRVSIEPFAVEIAFGIDFVHIEGFWSLCNAGGIVIDHKPDNGTKEGDRTTFELWRVLGTRVEDIQVEKNGPLLVQMHVSNGCRLDVRSDETGYESWQAHIGGSLLVCNGAKITTFRNGG